MIRPGATNRIENLVTGAQRALAAAFLFFLGEELLIAGLEPILFHPAVQGATA